VGEPLTGGGDAGGFERRGELGPGELCAAAQRFGEHGVAASKCRGIEPELAIAGGVAGDEARGDEVQHPADVRGRDELPGPAQRMGTNHGAVADRPFDARVGSVAGEPETGGPFDGGVVLGLDRAQPGDQVVQGLELRPSDLLSGEPASRES